MLSAFCGGTGGVTDVLAAAGEVLVDGQGALHLSLDVAVVRRFRSHGRRGQAEEGQGEDTGCGSSPTPQRAGVVLHGLGFPFTVRRGEMRTRGRGMDREFFSGGRLRLVRRRHRRSDLSMRGSAGGSVEVAVTAPPEESVEIARAENDRSCDQENVRTASARQGQAGGGRLLVGEGLREGVLEGIGA